jgi:hypothetical protein
MPRINGAVAGFFGAGENLVRQITVAEGAESLAGEPGGRLLDDVEVDDVLVEEIQLAKDLSGLVMLHGRHGRRPSASPSPQPWNLTLATPTQSSDGERIQEEAIDAAEHQCRRMPRAIGPKRATLLFGEHLLQN